MEQKAVYIGPNKSRQGETVTLRPHPREATYVLYTRGGSKFEFPDRAIQFEFPDRAIHYRIIGEDTNAAPEIDDTPAMEHMVYRGKHKSLYGKTALVRPNDDSKFLTVQFDDRHLGIWSHGWHRMVRSAFRPLGSVDLSQPSSYVSVGLEGGPDLSSVADTRPWAIDDISVPPVPTPTKPVRKVHRMGRLFDDAPVRTPVNHGPAPVSMMRVMDGEQWGAAVLVRGEVD